jgi:ribosomal protein S10
MTHQQNFDNFLKKTLFSFKKYKLDLQYTKKKGNKKKFTLLRSPHVNKDARDQIELKYEKFYFILKNKVLLKFFLFIFKKIHQYSFKLEHKIIKNQTLIYSNI